MKLSKRECFLINLLLLMLIWAAVFRLVIAPNYGSLTYTRQVTDELREEKAQMDLYLDYYPELEIQLKELEGKESREPFFYHDLDDVFIDRWLQSVAERAEAKILRMSIGEPVSMELPELADGNVEEWPLMERAVTMEVESRDVKGVMKFADGVYSESKSVIVSFVDMERETKTGTASEAGAAGMKGIVEVRFYYEKTK